ncbi:gem-associated protein 2-like [Clytia hemisphaerica]|uniref:gem-associated protein 2-like n=1 Tax=Clytia hemisphaerica TaxID=252671 RepID=UPI0034D421CF
MSMDVALGYFEDDDAVEYDLTKPPMSGIDYIKRVQAEAALCPDVVIAEQPKSSASLESKKSPAKKRDPLNRTRVFPTEERQFKVAEDFAFLRQKFNRVKTDPSSLCRLSKAVLPPVGSQQSWGRFCYGKDFTGTYFDFCLKGESGQLLNEGTKGQGSAPLLSVLLKLKQPMVVKLLKYNFLFLNVVGFSYDQSVWIHSLLVCLDKPLPSEASSTIRDLCRRVMEIRNQLTEPINDNILHQLNLIIILITRYFGQVDLLEESHINDTYYKSCLRSKEREAFRRLEEKEEIDEEEPI